MTRAILTFFIFSFLFLQPAVAQEKMTWDDFVELVTEQEEQAETEDWMSNLEDLQLLSLSPQNINLATKEDLLRLPFLSEKQASDLRDYIERYHGMKTLFELQLIPSITPFERQVLPLFFYAGPTAEFLPKKLTFRDMMKAHRHELLTRVDIPLYHRDGYLREDGYRGSRIYNKVRYTFTATQHLMASFHTERDAGERDIDSYGGQLMVKDIGHIAAAIVGDYRVGFGEGLVINQGFSMGKSSPLSHPSHGLRAQRGTDEYNFLRGAGLTLQWGDWQATVFGSWRQGDATLNEDGSIKTIITSGYHRTANEYSKKNDYTSQVVGGNVSWMHKGWHAGLSGYYQHLNQPLVPITTTTTAKSYRSIYPTGQHLANIGVDYGYEAYQWLIKGETAYDAMKHGLATLNTVSWRLNSQYRLTASQRYYSYDYYSTFASALSDNSGVQNETGATIRLDAQPWSGWKVTSYADFFYHPWPRYGVDHSSSGQEYVALVQYAFNRKNTLSARYSFKNKEYSTGIQHHHRLRLQWTHQTSDRWKWQTTAMLHTLAGSHGEAIGETVRYGLSTSFPLRFSLTGIYFHTTDYNSRVYLYEPNVTNTMSIPSFYGHGVRLAGTVQYTLWQNRLHFELKYGVTRYFDRDTQGSALQTIYSNVKNDITLQARFTI